MSIKQVILYRRDLKMRKGKIAAQCAHASLAVFLERRLPVGGFEVQAAGRSLDPSTTVVVPMDDAMAAWVAGRFTKVVLSVDDEDSLVRAHHLAVEAGLPVALIRDAGRTEFRGVPTLTTCAIGPAEAEVIDAITGPQGAISTRLA